MQSPSQQALAATNRRRGGRPSAEQAGDVDRRLLDAATNLFLTLGFDATSCDQIVVDAGAGKASLYARYANKEELFAAVVRRMVETTLLPSADVPSHLPVTERLRAVATSLLRHALSSDAVALMRVCVTTAHRMPELSRLVDRIGRDGGVACVVRAIAGDAMSEDRMRAASDIAARFIDMVFVPQQMRALIGDDPEELEREAARRIHEAISLFDQAGLLLAFDNPSSS